MRSLGLALASLFLLTIVGICHAKESIEKALEARDQGFPQVTIIKLSHLLAEPSLDQSQKLRILRELGRTYFEAGRLADAIQTLRPLSSDPIARFWLAQTLAAQGEFLEALPLYKTIPANSDLYPEAVLGVVDMLHALGRKTEALAALDDFPANTSVAFQATLEKANILLDLNRIQEANAVLKSDLQAASSPWGRFLLGRIAMSEERWTEAAAILTDIHPMDSVLEKNVLIARAKCLMQIGDLASAENILTKFIQEHAQSPALPIVFSKLDEVYSREGSPSDEHLRRWAEDTNSPFRAGYAKFYRARNAFRMGRSDRATQLFREFIQDLPLHPLANSARMELAREYLRIHQPQETLNILSGFQSKIPGVQEMEKKANFLRGSALFALNQYLEAAEAFMKATSPDSSPDNESALYNAAVSYLLAQPLNSHASNPARIELMRRYPGGHLLQELCFIEALQKAKWKHPDAAKALRAAAKHSSQAQLALAELFFVNKDSKAAAQQWLRLANSPESYNDRAAYLAIFLADSGSDEADSRVIQLARNFLAAYPKSHFKADVRMKLGEVFFRRGNFLGAAIQFESLANEFPDSPLTEYALFLAGQSNMRTMDPSAIEKAMLLFEEVAKMKGPLAWRARLEQARTQETAGHPDQALLILKNILAAKTDADIRLEALMMRGNILFAQGAISSENYAQAIQSWQQIVSDPGATLPWRNQALTKIGAAYQRLGDADRALANYYEVFNAFDPTHPEFFWFYKAGFDAGKLLESKKQWNEAMNVYERIASIPGPRAEEAKDRMDRLKQKNLIEK